MWFLSGQQIQLLRRPPRSGERQACGGEASGGGVAAGRGGGRWGPALAGSIALIGFGAGLAHESAAGIILLWRFRCSEGHFEDAERRAQKLIGVSFYVIAAYVGFEAVRSLLAGEHPEASWAGIGLAAVTPLPCPRSPSPSPASARSSASATKSEGQQNILCAYLWGRAARGPRRERPVRAVVGRPCDRLSAGVAVRGPRVLARRELLHCAGSR